MISKTKIDRRKKRKEKTHSDSCDPNGSQENINAPKNAPMKMQMIIYPLKYIASSMTKYATANCIVCNAARTTCSTKVGRISGGGAAAATGGDAFAAVGDAIACVSGSSFEVLVSLPGAPGLLLFWVTTDCGTDRYCRLRRDRRRMKASYSRPTRRRNSRQRTSEMTPMQEPPNMPWEVMCHPLEMKPD